MKEYFFSPKDRTPFSRISFDPNYDPETLYPMIKLFCLLYDEIYVWYPLQDLFQEHITCADMAELANNGIVRPVGESAWWEKTSRRQWPLFCGEWNDYDEFVSKHGLHVPFSSLIGDEKDFNSRVKAQAKIDSEDIIFREYILKRNEKPYKYDIRGYDKAFWFAGCFRSHREIALRLASYEYVAPNHEAIWSYLFRRVAKEYLGIMRLAGGSEESAFTSIEMQNVLLRFMEDCNLNLPKNLSVKEIIEFRKEGAAIKFREFLKRAYECAQEGQCATVDDALMKEYRRLSTSYLKMRESASISLALCATGPLIWYALAQDAIIGALATGAATAFRGFIVDEIKHSFDERIGRTGSSFSWVLHLKKHQ